MTAPSVGRIVRAIVPPSQNNGSDVAPAIITRVWSSTSVNVDNDTAIPVHVVNLRIFYDSPEIGWETSRYLAGSSGDARAIANAQPGVVAYWPERT